MASDLPILPISTFERKLAVVGMAPGLAVLKSLRIETTETFGLSQEVNQMYSLVLMMALSDGAALPSAQPVEVVPTKRAGAQELGRGCRGCRGCWGCYGGCWGCYGGCWGCYGGWGGNVVYRSHYYAPVAGYQSYYPTTGYQSFYGGGQPAQAATPAQIVVDLPADARLTIDDAPTQQAGSQRVFVTPALEPGYRYNYTLTATTVRNGETLRTTRKVAVTPGNVSQVRLDFTNREVAER
jgi:uncharacterized protein (TIGR03000 family)